MVTELAFAKINLALEVFPTRNDGFHEVNNLMIPLELHDVLTFEKISKGILLVDATNIPKEINYIYKAALLFMKKYKIDSGVKITLKKNIPFKAGLAGGSADASATLRGLNKLFDENDSLENLEDLASKLGSDMPYCLYQRFSLCTGRGEKVTLLESNINSDLDVLLIKPNFGLSTPLIYKEYNYEGISKKENIDNIINSVKNCDLGMLMNNIFNDLKQPALKVSRRLNEIIKEIEELGIRVYMSGSGPTLYIFNIKENQLKKLKKLLLDVSFYETKIKQNR